LNATVQFAVPQTTTTATTDDAPQQKETATEHDDEFNVATILVLLIPWVTSFADISKVAKEAPTPLRSLVQKASQCNVSSALLHPSPDDATVNGFDCDHLALLWVQWLRDVGASVQEEAIHA